MRLVFKKRGGGDEIRKWDKEHGNVVLCFLPVCFYKSGVVTQVIVCKVLYLTLSYLTLPEVHTKVHI